MSSHELGVATFQKLGGDGRVDEEVPSRLRHAHELGEGAVEVIHLLEDVPAPHEAEVAVAVGQFVDDALVQDNSVRRARLRHGTTPPLDVQCHRVDAHAGDLGKADELDEVSRIPAAGVEDHVARSGCRASSSSDSGPLGSRLLSRRS